MKSKEKIKLGRTNSEASIAVCVISNRIIWITFKKKNIFSVYFRLFPVFQHSVPNKDFYVEGECISLLIQITNAINRVVIRMEDKALEKQIFRHIAMRVK
jgi:hypothetical protein